MKVRKAESSKELTDCNGIGGRSRRGHDEETLVVVDGVVDGECWSVVKRELGFGGRKASASLCEYRWRQFVFGEGVMTLVESRAEKRKKQASSMILPAGLSG